MLQLVEICGPPFPVIPNEVRDLYVVRDLIVIPGEKHRGIVLWIIIFFCAILYNQGKYL
jgi:hypothetical protein